MSETGIAPEVQETARSRKMRLRILHAAEKIFLAHGFSGATTDMIQANAAISKSTLYSYFATKEELFKAVCHLKSDDFESLLRQADVLERDARIFLNGFGMEFLNSLLSADGLAFYRLIVAEAVRFPGLGMAFYHAGIKASTDMVERYLAEAHVNGRLNVPVPAISAEHLIGMLRGDIHLRVLLHIGKPPSIDQLRRYVAVTTDYFLTMHRVGGTLPNVKAYRSKQALDSGSLDAKT